MGKKWQICLVGIVMSIPVYGHDLLQNSDLQVIASLLVDNPEIAKANAEKLIKKDSDNTDLIAAIGTIYLRAGNVDEAAVYFNRALRCKKVSTTAINLGGDIARMRNKLDSAQYYYGRSMLFDRKDPEAYYRYAELLKDTDIDKAVETLYILKRNRPDLSVNKKIADIYYGANKFDKAIEVYDSIGIDSLDSEGLVQYALTVFLKKDYKRSLELANIGHERFALNPIFNRLRLYNNTELKSYDEALKSANDLFYHSEGAKLQYKDYIYYGYALNGLGKTQEAIAQFNIALEKNADDPSIKKQISDAYVNIKDYDSAIRYYRDYLVSLKMDNENKAFEFYQLGRLYWRKGIDNRNGSDMTPEKKEAITQANLAFAEVVALRPNSYLGYYWQAKANTLLDPDYQKGLAKPYFLKAAELLEAGGNSDEQLIECYKQISYYYYMKKELSTAKIYARKIQALDPEDDYAKQMLTAVKG